MKQSSKPISSSPSRGGADLFPPPLVSFLRADAGNRSKTGRSRSSPIFVRRKNAAGAAIETLEPSSPKVTCMGQVRVSSKIKTPAARCRWVRTVVSFNRRHCRTLWNRTATLFRRTLEIRRKSVVVSESRVGNETEEEEDDDGVFASAISLPPKNALILTRCRSTPHRSSYYCNRNRSSPMRRDGIGEEEVEEERHKTERRLLKNLESSIGEGDLNSVNGKESRIEEKSTLNRKSLILTRCKSEPGRIAEKLQGELNLGEEERSVMATKDSWLLNKLRLDD